MRCHLVLIYCALLVLASHFTMTQNAAHRTVDMCGCNAVEASFLQTASKRVEAAAPRDAWDTGCFVSAQSYLPSTRVSSTCVATYKTG
jgi:hypothetical protein